MNIPVSSVFRLNMLRKDSRILVAVSGGRDSVVLAHGLWSLGYKISLAHVNYHLRGPDSDSDELFVRNLAAGWGLDVFVYGVKDGDLSTGNVQQKAREIRYRFFYGLVEEHKFTHIATAHHLSDRIESLFLNLLRGTGIHGLNGMPERERLLIRPMLHASSEDIDAYVKANHLEFREDVSNASDVYARNRVRQDLIPMLNALVPNARERLQTSLNMLSADASAVKNMAEEMVENTGDGMLISFARLPRLSGDTWLYHCLRSFGFNRDQARNLHSSKGEGALAQSRSHTLVKTANAYVIRPIGEELKEVRITGPGTYRHGSSNYTVVVKFSNVKTPGSNWVHLEKSHHDFPFVLRKWKAGDSFKPIGKRTQNVSRYLTNSKIDRVAKQQTAVLCDSFGTILWLVGHAVSEETNSSEDATEVIVIERESVT